jgi:two-component system phosphate regulon sensor histidine kinase PhoR
LRMLIEKFIFLVELETGEAAATYNWRKRRFSDFRSLLEEVVEHNETEAKERNIRLVIEARREMPSVEGDRDYLRSALNHLVENAIKFSQPTGSTITLKAEIQGDRVLLSVSDQGRGIPPDEMNHIFEPFYQVDRERYEDQGAGSGLAIVHGIVELHNGKVRVESKVGEGSTFVVALPIAENDH